MLWFFLIFSTLAWGIAEIYYKKGNIAHEKYAHLKTTCFVGIFMGIYALVILLSQGLLSGPDGFKNFLINIVRYLPVSACYIISMTCSYFGVRFVEESISDPIENTSGAVVPILCAIFLHQTMSAWAIVVVVIIVIGILGVGFDQSIQKHFYLPEPQTDFIFAIYLEEFGFIGGVLFILLYAYLFITCFNFSKECDDLFGSFLIIGITSMIGIQTMINLGVVVGLFPVTGVTLPLMSYGGTSLLVTLIEIGIMYNIIKSI